MNPIVRSRVHKNPLLLHIFSQNNSVHVILSCLFMIFSNIILPSIVVHSYWPHSFRSYHHIWYPLLPCVLYVLSSFSVGSFCWYVANSTNYEAPRYVFFSSLLFLRPSSAQIFSSAHYSQISSVFILFLMWDTKFYTYTNYRQKRMLKCKVNLTRYFVLGTVMLVSRITHETGSEVSAMCDA